MAETSAERPLRYEPGDGEPFVKLRLMDDEEFIMRRDNSVLFTFLGKLALFNHIYCISEKDKNEEIVNGFYIFNDNPVYSALKTFMLKNAFRMQLNAMEVPECDQDAYIRYARRDIEDFEIPDDWEKS